MIAIPNMDKPKDELEQTEREGEQTLQMVGKVKVEL